MNRPGGQAPAPKPTMGTTLVLVCLVQWVGCIPTLALSFFALRMFAWAAWRQWGAETVFVLLSLVTLGGWLLLKAWHLILLAGRKPKFMKVYHWGVVFGAAGATACIIAFKIVVESAWGEIWLALLVPLALSILVTLYYTKSKRLAEYMLGQDYLGESPLIKLTRQARARQLEMDLEE